MKVRVMKSVGKTYHHQTPETIAECWLAQKSIVPTVGVSRLVKPSTDSVTSRPIDQLMLLSVVEKTIGSTKGRCSFSMISVAGMPEKTAVRVNSRVFRLIISERISRAS